MENYLNLLT